MTRRQAIEVMAAVSAAGAEQQPLLDAALARNDAAAGRTLNMQVGSAAPLPAVAVEQTYITVSGIERT